MDIKIEYIPDLDKYRIWNERYVNYAIQEWKLSN